MISSPPSQPRKSMPLLRISSRIKPVDLMDSKGSFSKSTGILLLDIYKLCQDFYNHAVNQKSINYSYITLVPKKSNPEKVSYFRPISLLNSSMKFITKILANRLQKVILQVCTETNMALFKGGPFKIARVDF